MKMILRTMAAVTGLMIATPAAAQATFYERQDFEGRSGHSEGELRS